MPSRPAPPPTRLVLTLLQDNLGHESIQAFEGAARAALESIDEGVRWDPAVSGYGRRSRRAFATDCAEAWRDAKPLQRNHRREIANPPLLPRISDSRPDLFFGTRGGRSVARMPGIAGFGITTPGRHARIGLQVYDCDSLRLMARDPKITHQQYKVVCRLARRVFGSCPMATSQPP
jgi:hypothetical protein